MKLPKSLLYQKIMSNCAPFVFKSNLRFEFLTMIPCLKNVDGRKQAWCVFFLPQIFFEAIHYKGDDSYFVSLKALVICTTSKLCCKAAAVLEFVVDEQGAYV